MSNIRQPLYGEAAERVREAIRRNGVPAGNVRATLNGHGQYQCKASDLDALIDERWGDSMESLRKDIREGHGDPDYSTDGLSKIELIMILAELSGFATN